MWIKIKDSEHKTESPTETTIKRIKSIHAFGFDFLEKSFEGNYSQITPEDNPIGYIKPKLPHNEKNN